jgi:hypothetical protein
VVLIKDKGGIDKPEQLPAPAASHVMVASLAAPATATECTLLLLLLLLLMVARVNNEGR